MKTQLHNAVSRIAISALISFVSACGGGEPHQASTITAGPVTLSESPLASFPSSSEKDKQ